MQPLHHRSGSAARCGDFVDRFYPIELEIKDTIDTDKSASYFDLHLEIDSEGRLRAKLYDKIDTQIMSMKRSQACS